MIKGHIVSVIIPAYNEEKTVGSVVSALIVSNKIDEIICIDDGSTDKTYEVLKKFNSKIRLIHYLKNKGKGYALGRGVKKAIGDIVIFCDSDLIDLTEKDLEKLAVELIKGNSRMVIGCPREKQILNFYIKSLAGERAFFRTDLTPHLNHFKSSRLGVETYLNHVFSQRVFISLNAHHLLKIDKMNSKDAFFAYLKEILEIARENAKLEGVWNDKFENQLKNVSKVKTWKQLVKRIKGMGNRKIRDIFELYILAYSQKIKSFFIE